MFTLRIEKVPSESIYTCVLACVCLYICISQFICMYIQVLKAKTFKLHSFLKIVYFRYFFKTKNESVIFVIYKPCYKLNKCHQSNCKNIVHHDKHRNIINQKEI